MSVAQFDTVVEDPVVVGAHAADVHRFQAADASVVLDLDAREVTQRVGHVVRIEPLEAFARELLHGNHLAPDDAARHDDLPDMVEAILGRLSVCLRHAPSRQSQGKQKIFIKSDKHL